MQTCHAMNGHTAYVSSIKVMNKRAFTGSWDTHVRSWNLETCKPMHVFKGHTNIVNCIDATEEYVFSGSWDCTVIQWSRSSGIPVHIFKGLRVVLRERTYRWRSVFANLQQLLVYWIK